MFKCVLPARALLAQEQLGGEEAKSREGSGNAAFGIPDLPRSEQIWTACGISMAGLRDLLAGQESDSSRHDEEEPLECAVNDRDR
jgi:hypothetical protein